MNIDEILKQFEQIQNWSNAGLTAVVCLGFGYIWKALKLKWTPNEAIPGVVCLVGIALFLGLSSGDGLKHTLGWYIRGGAVGFIIGATVAILHNFVISKIEDKLMTLFGAPGPKPPPTTTGTVGLLLALALPALMLAGCAHFSTKQTDVSYEKGITNGPSREITTKVSAYTFFSASSELSKFKANQTDKTQSASVGSLNQSSDVSTNVAAVIDTVVRAAINAAVGAQIK